MNASPEPNRSFETAVRNEERSFIDVELRDMSQRRLIVQPESHHPTDARQRSSQWRRWLRFSSPKHTLAHHDTIEELLAEAISSNTQSSASVQNLRRLQAEYRRFKRLPGQWSPSKNTVVSCNHLLSHWNFYPQGDGDDGPTVGKLDDTHQTHIPTNATVSDWFSRAVSILTTHHPGGLQLVYEATADKLNSEDLKNFLSFWVSTTATFRGHMTTLNLIPAWLVSFTLASCWSIEMDPLHNSDRDDIPRSRPLLPPSLRSLDDSGAADTKIIWGADSKRPGNLDPTRGVNEIHFTWRYQVTPFTSDFNVYIWEQHKSWPAAEHAKVIFCPAEKTTDGVRLLVSFTNSRTLAAFTKKRNLATVSCRGGSPGVMGIPSWSPVTEVVVSLCCIFEVMIADTAEFLGACHDEAMQMNIVGRKNPSTSKLRFLMHLEDCRKVGHDGVRHGLEILERLSLWIEQHQSPSAQPGAVFVDPFAQIWQDLEFFNTQFQQLHIDIQKDLEMLRGHFQLAQDLTLFRLTILAGVFLPLSFATSFFGMNMRRSSSGPPQGPEQSFSNYTNSTLHGLSPDMGNQTALLINALDNDPQTLTYSWPTFAGTAAGLVLILPLTLTIGAIIRAIIKSVTRYAIYWRIFMIFGPLLAFGFFVFSVWGAVFYEALFYVEFWYSINGFGFLITYWVCNGLVLVAELWQTYRGWTTKQRPIFWTTLMLLTGACFGLDMTVWYSYNFDTGDHQWVYKAVFRSMLLPWLFLGIDVGRRWRNSWVAQREREKGGQLRRDSGTTS